MAATPGAVEKPEGVPIAKLLFDRLACGEAPESGRGWADLTIRVDLGFGYST